MARKLSVVGRRSYTASLLLGPAFAFLMLVTVAPFLVMLAVSFTELNASEGAWTIHWVGQQQYQRLLEDSEVQGSAGRTLTFSLAAVAIEFILGMSIGEFLYRQKRWLIASLVTTLLPLTLAPVLVGLIWRLMYQGEFGILSLFLKSVGLFTSSSITSNHSTALLAIVIVDVWQWTPLVVLIYFAIRKSLENEALEAARLDGATEAELLRDIVLPRAAGALLGCAVLRFIDALREFDKIFILTGGGPGSATEVASLYIWRTAFREWSFGYAAALGTAFYLGTYALSWLSLRLAHKGIRSLRMSGAAK